MSSSNKANTVETNPQIVELTLAHSPDSDDAFMFYALATKKLRTQHISFKHVLEDIESLNQKAMQGIYGLPPRRSTRILTLRTNTSCCLRARALATATVRWWWLAPRPPVT